MDDFKEKQMRDYLEQHKKAVIEHQYALASRNMCNFKSGIYKSRNVLLLDAKRKVEKIENEIIEFVKGGKYEF